ncbi:SusD/RagB family nutrient-binding outer membrane lipoprotein [Chitinophaga sp. GCM10012297]|uniref:SusD/RagB family nutrient-binding outer membrane lipoprotein n=1 Tax=Chitinophaga chungangae TaxID=2821488 RepID=A0ABS3Y877_9BACT|nr:SusD/RagB family nutrient-binding outer membrane lipoprotein [Chitinophaga chungangae]MBO9150836.1 SusD/RagB family nutrient-binding outer membrane lipoprotein [Chitinophaga chungangae]
MTIKTLRRLAMLAAIPLIGSCGNLLEDANINKNNPSDIPLTGMLPSAEVALVYNNAADFSLRTSVFVQYISGIGGFAVNEDRYDFATSNFDGSWGKAYTNVLNNLSRIVKKAESTNAPRYAGVAKILTALALGTLTDAFGDIPYEEALNPDILAPGYESQEAIYARIQALLSAAVTDLQQTGGIAPGKEDLVYGGNVAQWTAAAWTLKARYALHLSGIDAQKAAQEALQFLYEGNTWRGIRNNDGDLDIVFGNSNNQASPWFTQNAGRPGWYGMGAYIVNLLNGNPPAVPVDPRRAAFAAPRPAPAPADTYVGALPGVPSAASNIAGERTYYGRNISPVSILSYPEAKFIEAEARLILNENDPLVKTALETAVRASFDKVASSADPFATPEKRDDYISKRVQLAGSFEQKLETVITQKYIALFLNPEAWTDYRRTGYPALSPATGGVTAINPTGGIPRRFAYPNSEANLNPKLPVKNSNLQTPKLWWDR